MARGGKRPGAGRPKGRKDKATIAHLGTLEDLARSHTRSALTTLVVIAEKGESEAARVSAANALLDRGYGKPKQAMEHTGKDGAPIQTEDVSGLTPVERQQRLAALLKTTPA
jgi:hypothetical protein